MVKKRVSKPAQGKKRVAGAGGRLRLDNPTSMAINAAKLLACPVKGCIVRFSRSDAVDGHVKRKHSNLLVSSTKV